MNKSQAYHKNPKPNGVRSNQSALARCFTGLRYRTLNAKFILLLMVLIFVPFSVLISHLEWLHYQNSYQQLQTKLDNITANHSLLLAKPLFENQQDQIELIASSLLSDPEIVSIAILNQDGVMIKKFGDELNTQENLSQQRAITYASNDQILNLGQLQLSLTDANIKATIKQRLYERSLMIAVFLIILVCAYIALRYTVGTSLRKILNAVDDNRVAGGV